MDEQPVEEGGSVKEEEPVEVKPVDEEPWRRNQCLAGGAEA